VTGLIDSAEMYLRTLYELAEEGIPPLRARLVERLHVSAPAASEGTARLAHEGLVEIAGDRTVHLTEKGLSRAMAVMRKHRLAELLLTRVIGLDWALVHNEACRWEHVISDEVEARLTTVLGDPERCPHGNRIPPPPGEGIIEPAGSSPISLLSAARRADVNKVRVGWISERLQTDEPIMRRLHDAGLIPGARVGVRTSSGVITVERQDNDGGTPEPATEELSERATEIPPATAALVYVEV
jgi:DtxR family Mn-dependent transcriptional regulator